MGKPSVSKSTTNGAWLGSTVSIHLHVQAPLCSQTPWNHVRCRRTTPAQMAAHRAMTSEELSTKTQRSTVISKPCQCNECSDGTHVKQSYVATCIGTVDAPCGLFFRRCSREADSGLNWTSLYGIDSVH